METPVGILHAPCRIVEVTQMIADGNAKQVNYKLRALPDGKFYFLLVGLEEPDTDKRLSMNLTEAEVREFYREKWGYSDAEIDERIQVALENVPDVADAPAAGAAS
jgi:hypothetical protein